MLPKIKILIIVLFTGMSTYPISAQSELSWETLADVTFEQKSLDDTDTYWLVPTFGEVIKFYQNQQVIVEGYLIVIDLEDNFCVLSKYPYASCFFCGAAGPDTIVELRFVEQLDDVQMDQRVRVRGKLKLNKSDIEHFNYIVTDARIID